MSGHDVHRDDMFDEDPMLTAFARDLQDAATRTPAPAIGASLAAVLEGRAPATVYPEVVETPRARVVRRPALLRWAVGAAACTLGFGSLGVAGALPGPVQRQVARMAGVIGVDVPDGEDDAPTTTPSTTSTTSTTISTTTSSAPPAGTTVIGGDPDAGEDEPGEAGTPESETDDDDRREDDDDPDEVEDSSGGDSSGLDSLELDDGDSSGPDSAEAGLDVDQERAEDRSGPGSGAEGPDGDDDRSGDEPDEDDANSSEQA